MMNAPCTTTLLTSVALPRASNLTQGGAGLLTGSGDLPGCRFQPGSQSGGVIELLREQYRVDRIAGRTDIQTGPQPRPGRVGYGQSKTACYANMTNVHCHD